MGTQGTGRKRISNKERLTAEDDALNVIAREAEARLAAKRAARAEAREIRMKELERQQKEVKSLGSRFCDCELVADTAITADAEASIREIKVSIYYLHLQFLVKHCTPAAISAELTCLRSFTGEEFLILLSFFPDLYAETCFMPPLTSVQLLRYHHAFFFIRCSFCSVPRSSSSQEIHELKDQIQDVEAKYMQSLKEVKDAMVEVEDKYRKAMVSNAQLDNEKSNLMYQVDVLKDSLMELEELLSETRRECEDKTKELEREKHAHGILQFQFNELKETLKQSEELLNEIRQLRLKQDCFVREIADLQETVDWKNKKIGALERQKEYSDAIRNERDELRDEVVQLKDILKVQLRPLKGFTISTISRNSFTVVTEFLYLWKLMNISAHIISGSSLAEIRLRKLVDERENLIEHVKRLKGQLEKKNQKNSMDEASSPDGEIMENGSDPNIMDVQRDASRQINDLKFKLVKSEQDVTALEQNVTRLEGQVTRYKSASENAEKIEDELKAEKRKLQRELRAALDKIEELEASNSHLSKRMEKMKSGRSTAQTPL
uniref:Leucine rich repeat (in FLII) interacting protein 1a n=1 Tax=Denticeps clupeoides TaxID=299321 RepID=A0AAY4B9X1_9TELE